MPFHLVMEDQILGYSAGNIAHPDCNTYYTCLDYFDEVIGNIHHLPLPKLQNSEN
jgi:hypothetical protein